MDERRCPNCDSLLASDQKVCDCCGFIFETEPEKKPAAKKKPAKAKSRKKA